MTPLDAVAVAVAGLAAGAVNAVVGAGSLITFPTLLAVGLPPVLANVSNTVGLVPGSLSAVVGYRHELRHQRQRALRLAAASAVGGVVGGAALLILPDGVFRRAVPVLILGACLLMAAQPRVARWLASREEGHPDGGRPLLGGVLGTGVYGGYFGAAQGVVLMALLGMFVDDDLQRLNAVKNVLALVANTVAAVLFVVATAVSWRSAALIAVGSVIGGQVGAHVGRRLTPAVLRATVVIVGSVVALILFAQYYA